jgi:hypothetical protein
MERASAANRFPVNPNSATGMWASTAFAGLAAVVIMLPQLQFTRPIVQLSSLAIALAAVSLNFALQRSIFNDGPARSKGIDQSLIVDLDRLERLS